MAAMPSPLYRIPALESTHLVLSHLSGSKLHRSLLPISAITLIHALRVSYATCQVQGGPRKIGLLQSVVLVWILLFGGWTIINLGLGKQTPLFDPGVQLTAAIYGAVHSVAVLSGLQKRVLKAASGAPATFGLGLDIFFHLVDAVCRTEGIIALGLNPVRDHPSPLTPIITSALIGGGGPLLIGLLDLESANWKLQTPTWLKNPTGLLAVDIWSAGIVALVYDSLTSSSTSPIAMRLFPGAAPTLAAAGSRPLLDINEARLVGSLLLFALLSLNRLRVFITASKPLAAMTANGTPKKGSSSASNGAKGSKNSGSRNSPGTAATAGSGLSTKVLLAAAVALPVSLLLAQWLLAGNDLKDGVLQGWVDEVAEAM
ncbi:hypothetical protein BDZ90DRAFT_229295 [Jaminaea rosea]|uniref:Uncharacterized protein n=1 Tax=Jaminaea rosea TaxID=1569628 RepID=A0A316UZ58_9BASI|nr:hypothetical protein BDZ90DRAFT_229295 [Jaminaea rosea]PWN30284.1 hypothetical protein BDZ90DRAFT_229295 [Jaminaea rosea]